jgi:hypothetical protein
MTPTGSIFSAEAIEGLRQLSKLFLVATHLFKGYEEENFSLTTIIDEDFGNVPSVNVDGDNHSIGMGE